MKCKWCEKTFLRGGPQRSFERLKSHVEMEHPAEVDHLLVPNTEHLPAGYGQQPMPELIDDEP